MLPRYPIRDGAGRWPPQPISANHDPASPVEERVGRRRLDGGGAGGVAPPGPRPPLLSSGGLQLPLRPEREPTAGGRAQLLPERQRGRVGPALLFLLPAAPSDMVAPGCVTSRLGSVFPFLLVLVDLQYEGKPGPALRWREERAPGSGPPALPRHCPGASLRAPRAVGGSRGGAARPGPEPAPGWGPVPGSGFLGGKRCRGRPARGGNGGFGVEPGPKGSEEAGRAGPGERLRERRGARRPEQPSGPASRGTLARRLATLWVRGTGRRRSRQPRGSLLSPRSSAGGGRKCVPPRAGKGRC